MNLEAVRRRCGSTGGAGLADETLAWLYALADGYSNAVEMKALMDRFPTLEEFSKRYNIALSDPKIHQACQRAGDAWRDRVPYEKYLRELKEQAEAEGVG